MEELEIYFKTFSNARTRDNVSSFFTNSDVYLNVIKTKMEHIINSYPSSHDFITHGACGYQVMYRKVHTKRKFNAAYLRRRTWNPGFGTPS